MVYERLIDNHADTGLVVDLRVPVIGRHIPFIYKKAPALDKRFSNSNAYAALFPVEEVISDNELDALKALSQAMGLDLGELDVLRDRENGRIYVVDVNPTAWGPPEPLSTSEVARAVNAYAAGLVAMEVDVRSSGRAQLKN